MIIGEIVKLSFDAIRANKLRSGLTMLGIAIGVFTVIGVMTVITGVQSNIESSLNVLGANSFQISKYPALNFSDPRERFRNRRDVDFPMARRFKEMMGDSATISLSIIRGGRIASNGEMHTNPNVVLSGTDENFVTARDFTIAAGRNLTPNDVELGRAVVVIGDEIARKLFPDTEAIGKRVRIDQATYLIVGVFAAKGSLFGQSQDLWATVPITSWLQTYGRANRSISISVQAASPTMLPATQDHAIGTMRIIRHLAPEDPNDFEIFSNDSLIEAFNKIAGVVATGALVISAIALLASGVGVMNIMLVSVTERTKEIGVRKSIGARKKNIMTQFLMEAVALSLTGGFFGILFGVAVGNIAGRMFHASVVFPWMWAGIGVAVCCGIGIGFGLYPAWKASSLDPIEALRYE
ncbi:MAG TPA: ABC transporter permease [Opitutaceae bacterium]|nr:ABC transporter permease [Opitutaceae bacterium]